MFRLWAAIKKDFRILLHDSVGIIIMFGMPIILVVIITSIQNTTFELASKKQVSLLVCNRDTGALSTEFLHEIDSIGIFRIILVQKLETVKTLADQMNSTRSVLAMVIPSDFSPSIDTDSKIAAGEVLNSFGMKEKVPIRPAKGSGIPRLYYQAVIEVSYRQSLSRAINGALQLVESRQLMKRLYFSMNQKQLSPHLENKLLSNRISVQEFPLTLDKMEVMPNATQHNVPAWTIFAMFFVVISLGGSIVNEKLSGSFIRLKTLPTSFILALISKQITYLFVTLVQASVIFSLGLWIFPLLGLPPLNLNVNFEALILVSIVCGWCAVSYAICIGVFANTQEQANGFGAVSIVILAALGGLMVPSFLMPSSLLVPMKLSPLHWCLEAYYKIFLEGGKLHDVVPNIIPLLLITIFFQLIAIITLKAKKLI